MRRLGCIGTDMKYNMAIAGQSALALEYLVQLINDKKIVEIKKISPKRSLNQNSYLHLLLGYFGQHFGYTVEEAKEIYKRLPGNKQIYIYEKDVGGKPMTFTRSSADLNKDEMTKTIEVLRDWSDKLGFPLPTATDQEWLRQIENEIERSERYL